jgi:hypothetical protein
MPQENMTGRYMTFIGIAGDRNSRELMVLPERIAVESC